MSLRAEIPLSQVARGMLRQETRTPDAEIAFFRQLHEKSATLKLPDLSLGLDELVCAIDEGDIVGFLQDPISAVDCRPVVDILGPQERAYVTAILGLVAQSAERSEISSTVTQFLADSGNYYEVKGIKYYRRSSVAAHTGKNNNIGVWLQNNFLPVGATSRELGIEKEHRGARTLYYTQAEVIEILTFVETIL